MSRKEMTVSERGKPDQTDLQRIRINFKPIEPQNKGR